MLPTVRTYREIREAESGGGQLWRLEWGDTSDRVYSHEVEAKTPADAQRQIVALFRGSGTSLELDDAMTLPGARFDRVEAWGAETPIAATPYAWCEPATLPRARWIYGKQLLRGHLHLTVAPGGVGKTSFRIATALALVTGLPLLGHPVFGGPKRVWLWNLEDGREQLARMIQAACKHYGLGPGDIGDRLYVDSAMDGAQLVLAADGAAGATIDANTSAGLVAELRARRIDYLNVDPFQSSHRTNGMDNDAMDVVAKEWSRIAHVTDAAVDLTMHTNKLDGKEVTVEAVRGAKALTDAARSVMLLNQMTADEADKLGVEQGHRRRYLRAYDGKPNRAPPAERSDWFRLASVDLGNGGIEGGDSMGVIEPWAPTDAMDGMPADALYRVQLLIAGGAWLSHHQADAWAGIAVAEALKLDADDKADRERIAKLIRQWVRDKGLVEVERKDTKKGRDRKYIEVGKWAGPIPHHPESGVGIGGVTGVEGADEAFPPPPPL